MRRPQRALRRFLIAVSDHPHIWIVKQNGGTFIQLLQLAVDLAMSQILGQPFLTLPALSGRLLTAACQILGCPRSNAFGLVAHD